MPRPRPSPPWGWASGGLRGARRHDRHQHRADRHQRDVGVSPGTAVTGLPARPRERRVHPPGRRRGACRPGRAGDGVRQRRRPGDQRRPIRDLAGQTLVGGVYTGGALALNGTVTLDGENVPDTVWIFQAASTLITGSDSSVALVNGANPCNVFWQVGSSATLGTDHELRRHGHGADLDHRRDRRHRRGSAPRPQRRRDARQQRDQPPDCPRRRPRPAVPARTRLAHRRVRRRSPRPTTATPTDDPRRPTDTTVGRGDTTSPTADRRPPPRRRRRPPRPRRHHDDHRRCTTTSTTARSTTRPRRPTPRHSGPGGRHDHQHASRRGRNDRSDHARSTVPAVRADGTPTPPPTPALRGPAAPGTPSHPREPSCPAPAATLSHRCTGRRPPPAGRGPRAAVSPRRRAPTHPCNRSSTEQPTRGPR